MAISTIKEPKITGEGRKNNNKTPVDGSAITVNGESASESKEEPKEDSKPSPFAEDGKKAPASPQKQGNQPQNRGNQNRQNRSGNGRPQNRTMNEGVSPQKMNEISNLAGQVKTLQREEQNLLLKMVGITPVQAEVYNPSAGRVERINFVVDEDMLASFGVVFRMMYGICELRRQVGQGSRLAATPCLSKLLRDTQGFYDEQGRPLPPALFKKILDEAAYVAAIAKAVERESSFFKASNYQRRNRNDLRFYEPVSDALTSEDYTPRLEIELQDFKRAKKRGAVPFLHRPLFSVLRDKFGDDEQQEVKSGKSAPASSGIDSLSANNMVENESNPETTEHDGETPSSVGGEAVVEAGVGY